MDIHERVSKLLERLEWSGTTDAFLGPEPACPVCHGLKDPLKEYVLSGYLMQQAGHRPDCELAACMKLLELPAVSSIEPWLPYDEPMVCFSQDLPWASSSTIDSYSQSGE